MTDLILSLTNRARQLEAQALLYGYGYQIHYFAVGSGGHDPGNPTLALPLNSDAPSLPGQFFGPQPINISTLISPTCPQWTCILNPGDAVGGISNFGLIATVTFVPASSFLMLPSNVAPGTAAIPFPFSGVNTSSGVFTTPTHGFADGTQVIFNTSNSLPQGISATTIYFIVNSSLTTFQVSLTSGGLPIVPITQGVGTHTVRRAADDTFTFNSHGLANGDIVNIISTANVPDGIVSAESYYVVYATTNTFKLSEILGGPAIDLSSTGSGILTVTNLSSLAPGAPAVGSTFLFAQVNFPLHVKLSSSRETYSVTLQT